MQRRVSDNERNTRPTDPLDEPPITFLAPAPSSPPAPSPPKPSASTPSPIKPPRIRLMTNKDDKASGSSRKSVKYTTITKWPMEDVQQVTRERRGFHDDALVDENSKIDEDALFVLARATDEFVQTFAKECFDEALRHDTGNEEEDVSISSNDVDNVGANQSRRYLMSPETNRKPRRLPTTKIKYESYNPQKQLARAKGNLIFPMSRVQKIVKAEHESVPASKEAIFVIAGAAEEFMKLLINSVHRSAVGKPYCSIDTIELEHVANVVCTENFTFLQETIPKTIPLKDALYLQRQTEKRREEEMFGAADTQPSAVRMGMKRARTSLLPHGAKQTRASSSISHPQSNGTYSAPSTPGPGTPTATTVVLNGRHHALPQKAGPGASTYAQFFYPTTLPTPPNTAHYSSSATPDGSMSPPRPGGRTIYSKNSDMT